MTRPERRASQPPPVRLPWTSKAVYALGDHTVNAALAALSFHYLFFLTQVAGLRPALAGLVPWIGRIVDAFTDPVMGRISDRTPWRHGRRRPYFLIGAIPFGLAFALLWVDVPFDSQLGLLAYYAAAYVLFSICITVLSVPYLALIPEMAFDYHERTSLNGYRAAGAMFGAFVAVSLRLLAEERGDGSPDFASAAAIVAVWLTVPWLAVYAVSFERPGFRREAHDGFVAGMVTLLRHRAYRIVAGVYLCSRVAVDIVLAMMIFYFEYWLGRRGDFEPSMLLLLASVVASLPLWLGVARRTDKRTLFMVGASVWMTAQLAFLVVSPDWSRTLVFAVAVLAGLGYGAVEVMPWSMLGDVVDEDELATGERREGLYAGSFMFLRKLGGPSGVLLAGIVLELAGFEAGGEPGASSVQAIRALTGLAPLAFIGLAVWLASRYPLSHAAHTRVLAQLAQRGGAT